MRPDSFGPFSKVLGLPKRFAEKVNLFGNVLFPLAGGRPAPSARPKDELPKIGPEGPGPQQSWGSEFSAKPKTRFPCRKTPQGSTLYKKFPSETFFKSDFHRR